jgi:hypothetical protein
MKTNKLKRLLKFLWGLIILLLFIYVNQWVFKRWFQVGHFEWYLKNGALIGIATSVVSLVWGNMREHTGLISSNPWDYMGSYLQLVGLPIFVLGTHLKSDIGKAHRASLFDIGVSSLLFIVLCIVLLIWLVAVVPVQYFVYLICGAPGRIVSSSRCAAIAKLDGSRLAIKEIRADGEMPDGWWNAGFADKPVAITGLFSSILFVILKSMVY